MPQRSPALVLVHVVWATFRRHPMLPPEFDDRLAAILGSKARETKCMLLATGCASDHVHAVLRLEPSVALANLVQKLKGATAHDVNERHLLPHRIAWQRGYWAESLAPADRLPLEDYLRLQRSHHDDSHPAEQWQTADWESAEGGL